MKHKVLVKPEELKVGMKVKSPVAGWWLSSNKKQVWYKGTVLEIGTRGTEISSVIISLRSRKINLGRMMFLGKQCKTDIYKVL